MKTSFYCWSPGCNQTRDNLDTPNIELYGPCNTQDAAEKFAETFWNGKEPQTLHVLVENRDGLITKWIVEPKHTIIYFAKPE